MEVTILADNEYSPTDALVRKVKGHYDVKEQAQEIDAPEPENRNEKGKFAQGVSENPGGRPKGVVDCVKAETKNYVEPLDLLLRVSRDVE